MRDKPKPKSDHFPVAMALDSGEQSQLAVTGVKNTRLKRLKVRRLNYTCRTKMNVEMVKQLEEKKKKEDSHDPAKNRISFSMSSTSEKGVVTSSQRDSSEKFSAYGSVSIIGRRREMEDALTVELGLMTKSNDSRDGTCTRYDFFGVYDGHGGAHVARACEKRLHGVLVAEVGEHPGEGVEYWERVMEGCFGKWTRR
ncbi:putative protein phosphatase 2C 51 [Morella rubra]|uniref:protein-serine/threonine phosphatase n=1 Tax=Morella rubra TaxID=262757 RepID=A0A6A1V102_9ROSI|nr:putative protein phosphatase 2C 51 [Morella rubra]